MAQRYGVMLHNCKLRPKVKSEFGAIKCLNRYLNQPMGQTMQLNPYLNLNGQCEAAFKFYGGKRDCAVANPGDLLG